MIVYGKIDDLQKQLRAAKKRGLTVGFVPTMGALHKGHISLVEKSKLETGLTVVSIFVNPTQFNNPDDLIKYPRTPEKDLKMLEQANADIVFMPALEEMYPQPATIDKEAANSIKIPTVNTSAFEVMEGKHRPGHFQGVIQIVSKLFEIVKPDKAFFGEKDFQQLFVIRQLVREKNYPVQIVGCPTMREASGLAMSSRNMLLSEEEKDEAGKIYKALLFTRHNKHVLSVEEAKTKASCIIEGNGKMKIEYLEIADEETLQSVAKWDESKKLRCFAAVQLGKVRLIDNLAL